MKDSLLEAFFEMDRWEAAIEKGLLKDIDKGTLARLCTPEGRLDMCRRLEGGTYAIKPPHTARIPKDEPGEYRTVYVNEPEDRILLAIANDLLFEKMPGAVHPRCMSYLKGVGCGKVVQEASREAVRGKGCEIGFKADLSKYFDSVPLEFIDRAFDLVEERNGKSMLVKAIRDYYHSDKFFNSETKRMEEKFQSLKQGCSVAAWLADVVLRHVDDRLASMRGWYVRYSDDILYIGDDWHEAMSALEEELSRMSMGLNPKKVEVLRKDRWFKFLGFSIRGADITVSRGRLKKFQHEVQMRSTKCRSMWRSKDRESAYRRCAREVCRFLYKGDGDHSWATSVLPVVNVKPDLDEMSKFVMDCIRAIRTGKRRTGGLGYDASGKYGVVVRGKGANVTSNRLSAGDRIEGFNTLGMMRNAMLASRSAYWALCAAM